MSSDKTIFTNLKSCQGGNINFGDDKSSKIIRKCIIQAPRLPVLNNILLVDDLKANLLNIS